MQDPSNFETFVLKGDSETAAAFIEDQISLLNLVN